MSYMRNNNNNNNNNNFSPMAANGRHMAAHGRHMATHGHPMAAPGHHMTAPSHGRGRNYHDYDGNCHMAAGSGDGSRPMAAGGGDGSRPMAAGGGDRYRPMAAGGGHNGQRYPNHHHDHAGNLHPNSIPDYDHSMITAYMIPATECKFNATCTSSRCKHYHSKTRDGRSPKLPDCKHDLKCENKECWSRHNTPNGRSPAHLSNIKPADPSMNEIAIEAHHPHPPTTPGDSVNDAIIQDHPPAHPPPANGSDARPPPPVDGSEARPPPPADGSEADPDNFWQNFKSMIKEALRRGEEKAVDIISTSCKESGVDYL